jgi:hypothetical protein
MNDHQLDTTEFDRQADRIMGELGLGPDAPSTDLTHPVGFEFGTRLLSVVGFDPSLVKSFSRDVLQMYRDMFPPDPDPGTIEFQTYTWAPWVSKWLTGRGLTVPQLAKLADRHPEHVYRLMRNGLRISFAEVEPPAKRGVNRRYSGVDGRETYLLPDPKGLTERSWPSPAEEYRPFISGLMQALQSRLDDPNLKAKLEPFVMEALRSILTGPVLRDVFDGAVGAIQRIATDLRDKVLTMKTEKERATVLAHAMGELATQKELFFQTLAEAADKLPGRATGQLGGGQQ